MTRAQWSTIGLVVLASLITFPIPPIACVLFGLVIGDYFRRTIPPVYETRWKRRILIALAATLGLWIWPVGAAAIAAAIAVLEFLDEDILFDIVAPGAVITLFAMILAWTMLSICLRSAMLLIIGACAAVLIAVTITLLHVAGLPLACPIALVGAGITAVSLLSPFRLSHLIEAQSDRCTECGYQLRGLKEHRCPECGVEYRGNRDSQVVRSKTLPSRG